MFSINQQHQATLFIWIFYQTLQDRVKLVSWECGSMFVVLESRSLKLDTFIERICAMRKFTVVPSCLAGTRGLASWTRKTPCAGEWVSRSVPRTIRCRGTQRPETTSYMLFILKLQSSAVRNAVVPPRVPGTKPIQCSAWSRSALLTCERSKVQWAVLLWEGSNKGLRLYGSYQEIVIWEDRFALQKLLPFTPGT
jgi:hypothetical protein